MGGSGSTVSPKGFPTPVSCCRLRTASGSSVSSPTMSAPRFGEREVAFVGRTREPLRRDAADPLAAADIHLVTAARVPARIENLHVHGTNLHDGRGSLSPTYSPVTKT